MVVVVEVIVVVSAVAGTRCHRRTTCRQWALCVVAGGCVSSITSLGVSLRPGGKVGVVSEGYRKMDPENEPRQASWLVFCNSQLGPPTSRVARTFLPPRILRRTRFSRPHPFEKGRDG